MPYDWHNVIKVILWIGPGRPRCASQNFPWISDDSQTQFRRFLFRILTIIFPLYFISWYEVQNLALSSQKPHNLQSFKEVPHHEKPKTRASITSFAGITALVCSAPMWRNKQGGTIPNPNYEQMDSQTSNITQVKAPLKALAVILCTPR